MVINDTTDILQIENLCSEIHITCHICPKGSIYIGAKDCLIHQSVTRLFECLRTSFIFRSFIVYTLKHIVHLISDLLYRNALIKYFMYNKVLFNINIVITSFSTI